MRNSFDSANGPSVTAGAPVPSERTMRAWSGHVSPSLNTISPESRSSWSNVCWNSMCRLMSSGAQSMIPPVASRPVCIISMYFISTSWVRALTLQSPPAARSRHPVPRYFPILASPARRTPATALLPPVHDALLGWHSHVNTCAGGDVNKYARTALVIGAVLVSGVAGAAVATAASANGHDNDKTAAVLRALDGGRAKNVIMFLGDGMGDSEITIARNYAKGAAGRLTMDGLPFTGEYTTYAVQKGTADVPDYVTDSAASGTGWATG